MKTSSQVREQKVQLLKIVRLPKLMTMRAKKRVLRMFGVMLNNKDLKIQYVNNRTPFMKLIKKSN